MDEGEEVSLCLLAAEGDALEALELADRLFDAGAASVEGLGEEVGFVLFVGLGRDDGNDPALSRRLTVGLAVIALVADRCARIDIGTTVLSNICTRCAEGDSEAR